MTPMVYVLWDVKRGSMETNVTDNVHVVRQVVTNLQDDVMETVKTVSSGFKLREMFEKQRCLQKLQVGDV